VSDRQLTGLWWPVKDIGSIQYIFNVSNIYFDYIEYILNIYIYWICSTSSQFSLPYASPPSYFLFAKSETLQIVLAYTVRSLDVTVEISDV
jgi:hypothetical protein